jgi:hypothetical protein
VVRGALLAAVVVLVGCSGSDDASGDGGGSGGGAEGRDTTTTTVQAPEYRSEVYGDEANWLCLPGRTGDACDVDLDATLVRADGSTEVQPFRPAEDPALDCFYVYPTISGDPPPNADLDAGGEERGVTATQFARFGEVCRTYAPIYRQVPLAALSALSGVTTTTAPGTPDPRQVAYDDVLDAWRHYLSELNPSDDGAVRPFVLIGHSQGAGHLRRLVAEEIGPDEALRSRMAGALLIGSGVPAPGSPDAIEDVPPCTEPGQRGCIVSYATFLASEPPPENSLFGAPREGTGRVLCTNPAALGGGAAPLDTYVGAPPGGTVTTPYVRYEGLVDGECVQEGRFDYLQVTSTWAEGDARPADLGGRITPAWGLHLLDVNLAQGDLIEMVRTWADQPTD